MKPSRLERRAHKKTEREAMIKSQREAYQRREKNKKLFNYAIIAVIGIAIIYGAYVALKPEGPGLYDDFAKCLTSEGATMYGTDWCPHCQAQKQRFGPSFKYVTYINCDLNGAACNAAGVQGYPTWVFPDGTSVSGEQELETLAARSGCTL